MYSFGFSVSEGALNTQVLCINGIWLGPAVSSQIIVECSLCSSGFRYARKNLNKVAHEGTVKVKFICRIMTCQFSILVTHKKLAC